MLAVGVNAGFISDSIINCPKSLNTLYVKHVTFNIIVNSVLAGRRNINETIRE